MRLTHAQVSIRTFLFVVAMLAIDCAAYRSDWENRSRYHPDSVWGAFPDGFVVGVLPLFNVAAVGSFLYLIRRFGSRGRTRRAGPQSRPAGVTYFTLHFLASVASPPF